jgi:hypothetical protein
MGMRSITLEINKVLYCTLSGYGGIHMRIILKWILYKI